MPAYFLYGKVYYGGIILCTKIFYYDWAWDYWTIELEWTLEVIFVSLFIQQIYSNMCLLSAWGPKRPEKWLSTLCFESPGNIFKKHAFPGLQLRNSDIIALVWGLDVGKFKRLLRWFFMLIKLPSPSIKKWH